MSRLCYGLKLLCCAEKVGSSRLYIIYLTYLYLYESILFTSYSRSNLQISSISHIVTGKTRTKDKYRVVYTDHQRVELEKEFYYSRYITIRRKAELASNLGLSERQVKIWFQNRRAKERKQVKKRSEFAKDDGNSLNLHQQQQQQHHQNLIHTAGHQQHQHAQQQMSTAMQSAGTTPII